MISLPLIHAPKAQKGSAHFSQRKSTLSPPEETKGSGVDFWQAASRNRLPTLPFPTLPFPTLPFSRQSNTPTIA
jgi:hypothetical protein